MTTTFTFSPTPWRDRRPNADNLPLDLWAGANVGRHFRIVAVREHGSGSPCWLEVNDAYYDDGGITDDDEVQLADEDGKALNVSVPHQWLDLDEPEPEWTREDAEAEAADRRYAEAKDEGRLGELR